MNTSRVRHLATAAALCMAVAGPPVAVAETYSGRAYGAQVKLINPNPNVLFFSDTGQLPAPGGSLSATLLTILLGTTTLSSHTITASCSGGAGQANSSASQENAVVFGGQPAQVTASVVASQAHADCGGVSGSSVVTGLTFGGSAVAVTGQPNQTVTVLGVATLIINEQIVGVGARDITVNALHLILGTGEEVILSSSHSDVGCTTKASSPTWGAVKLLYR